MRVPRWVMVSAAALFTGSFACGGTKSTPAQGSGTDAGGADVAGTSSGTPSGSGAPATDGGASGGTASGGPAAGTTNDGGTSGTASSGPGTGATGACDGLLPTPGTPVTFTQDVSSFPSCLVGTVDGDGTTLAAGLGNKSASFTLYALQGDPGGKLFIGAGFQDTGPDFASIVPTATGFHAVQGLRADNVGDRGPFTAFDAQGHVLSNGADLSGQVRLVKRDPATGGSALLTVSGSLDAPAYHLDLTAPDGHPLASAALAPGAPLDLAVAQDGSVLVLALGSARWFDGSAQPLTGWFSVPAPATGTARRTLFPLADGSIALRENDGWAGLFQRGIESVGAVPAWLASRLGVDVRVVRGGSANAIVPATNASGGTCTFEMVTSAGESCGSVELSSATSCSGVAFGADGSAIALTWKPSGTTGNQLCTWQVWPGLVR